PESEVALTPAADSFKKPRRESRESRSPSAMMESPSFSCTATRPGVPCFRGPASARKPWIRWIGRESMPPHVTTTRSRASMIERELAAIQQHPEDVAERLALVPVSFVNEGRQPLAFLRVGPARHGAEIELVDHLPRRRARVHGLVQQLRLAVVLRRIHQPQR